MPEPTVIEILLAIASIPGISYQHIALASGCGVANVQGVLRDRKLPVKHNSRRALTDFALKNQGVTRRGDLRFGE